MRVEFVSFHSIPAHVIPPVQPPDTQPLPPDTPLSLPPAPASAASFKWLKAYHLLLQLDRLPGRVVVGNKADVAARQPPEVDAAGGRVAASSVPLEHVRSITSQIANAVLCQRSAFLIPRQEVGPDVEWLAMAVRFRSRKVLHLSGGGGGGGVLCIVKSPKYSRPSSSCMVCLLSIRMVMVIRSFICLIDSPLPAPLSCV